jgi:hypothetical protein
MMDLLISRWVDGWIIHALYHMRLFCLEIPACTCTCDSAFIAEDQKSGQLDLK